MHCVHTEISFDLVLRQVWGIKYVCHSGINKHSHKCECRMGRITDVRGRWKTFYRTGDIEVGSKDALTEKEKSRIRGFQSEETFVENWGMQLFQTQES